MAMSLKRKPQDMTDLKGKAERKRPSDPVERIVFDALTSLDVPFTMGGEPGHPDHNLDFNLTGSDIAIECKWDYTPRCSEQLSRQRDIILIQGVRSAEFFAYDILKAKAALP